MSGVWTRWAQKDLRPGFVALLDEARNHTAGRVVLVQRMREFLTKLLVVLLAAYVNKKVRAAMYKA